jgi:hypothetical protein
MADAIEANALNGGRRSISGSLYITLQTLISNACGSSVGLEAAYTQISAALASLFGRGLAARRSDLRLLVGCGAAGAIAAAFGAPLAGAFYAFEVVLGAYSVGSLMPVAASAIVASLISKPLVGHDLLIMPGPMSAIHGAGFAHLVALAEALTTCKVVGLDMNTAYEAIRISSGNSFVHETESQVILNGSRDISFTMDLVIKDVGLFDQWAQDLNVPLELSPLVLNIFKDGQAKYGPREHSPNIIRRIEEPCGVKVLGQGFPADMVDDEPEEPGYEVIAKR